MIIKLNIFNMEKFLEMLNKCSGAINLLSKDKKTKFKVNTKNRIEVAKVIKQDKSNFFN